MKTYDAVFFMRDPGNDVFIILKRGECIFDGRRVIGFRSQKDAKLGDLITISFDPNGSFDVKDNPYFKIVTKKECTPKERGQNLITAGKLLIEEDYTTEAEKQGFNKVCGVKFFEDGYFYDICNILEALYKMYSKEKIACLSKKSKEEAKNFSEKHEKLLGISQKESFDGLKFDIGLKRIRKARYSIFTPMKTIVLNMHEEIKKEGLHSLNAIKNYAEMYYDNNGKELK